MKTKKALSILLALLLVFSSSIAVFAIDYYEEWGPMGDWTDEQWEQSDSWTKEDWETYYEKEHAAWEIEYKQKMGFTNLTGINVFFDGACLNFGDVTPAIRNGYTMVPFRTIFEAFGAEVNYKVANGKRTITAELNGTTLILTMEELSMEIVQGDSTETAELPISPYIANNHSYVPLRAISEGLGYDVIWNEWDRVVEIIDDETLIAEIDERFSLYNRILSDSIYDAEATYKTTGNISSTAKLYGDTEGFTGSLKSDFTVLQQGLNVDMKANVKLDLDAFSESLTYLLNEDMMKTLSALKDTPFEFIMDADSWNIFVKSPFIIAYMKQIFSSYSYYYYEELPEDGELPEFSLKENDWLEAPFGESLMDMPEDFFEPFMDPSKLTLGKLLYLTAVPSDGKTWSVNLYTQMLDTVNLIEVFFGDVNFVKKGTSYVLEMDRMELMKQLAPLLVEELGDMSITDAFGFLQDVPEANYKVILTEKNSRLSDIDISGLVKLNGVVPVTISFGASGDDQSSKCNFSVTGRYFGKLEFQMDSLTAETTQSLRTAPPAGENIVNLTDFYNEMFEVSWGDEAVTENSEYEPTPPEETPFDKDPAFLVSRMVAGLWENGGSPIVPNRIKGVIHAIQLNHLPYQR